MWGWKPTPTNELAGFLVRLGSRTIWHLAISSCSVAIVREVMVVVKNQDRANIGQIRERTSPIVEKFGQPKRCALKPGA